MSHPNENLIRQFYQAFARGDAAVMSAAYHGEARFHDPVFLDLQGGEIGKMWEMLSRQAVELEIDVKNITADDEKGSADWSARYRFGRSGRKVHNRIHAEFTFRDGKILTHRDEFNLWTWSRMALGPLGFVMGWNAVVQANIRQQARRNLTKFMEGTKKS